MLAVQPTPAHRYGGLRVCRRGERFSALDVALVTAASGAAR